MKRKAFTLSEVLVCLGIIGVVAAITIPSLSDVYRTRLLESSFKKAYHLLDESTKIIYAKDPTIFKKAPIYNGTVYADANTLYNYYYDLLQVTGNLNNGNYKIYNYNKTANSPMGGGRFAYPNKVLANGMLIGFFINEGQINMTVDTNGIKPPNQLGHDIFCFHATSAGELTSIKMYADMTEEEIKNATSGNKYESIDKEEIGDPCSRTSKQKSNGYGCSYYAIANKSPNDSTKTYWEDLP